MSSSSDATSEDLKTSRVVLLAAPASNELSSLKKQLEIFTFDHPKYNRPVKFGLLTTTDPSNDSTNSILLEMERIGKSSSSWFVGNNVISDGRPFVLTPMDVTFLLIAALDKNASSDETNFDNFSDVIPPLIQRVSSARSMIHNICDVMDGKCE